MTDLLFIGNSHTYVNDLPHTVAELYRLCDGETVNAVMLAQGGQTLAWHDTQEQTAYNLRFGHYDAVILQDALLPFEQDAAAGHDGLIRGVDRLVERIRPTGAAICLYMTWVIRERPDLRPVVTDSYREAAAAHHLLLAPAGDVWETMRRLCPACELYAPDGRHASRYGSYLAACTLFCTLTGRTSLDPDRSDPFYAAAGLDPAYCAVIHRAVAETLTPSGKTEKKN